MARGTTDAANRRGLRTDDAVKALVSGVAGTAVGASVMTGSPVVAVAGFIFVCLILLYCDRALRRLSCLPVIEWGRFRLGWTRHPHDEGPKDKRSAT